MRTQTLSMEAIVVLVLSFLLVNTAHANLIVNGDFESGYTGYSTDYTVASDPMAIQLGEYILTDNPSNHHVLGQDYGDHTTGSGLMMMVEGSVLPGWVVWSQTVSVDANQDYQLSTWVSNWSTGHNATLDFTINGTSIGIFNSFPTGAWGEFSTTFNSGSNTALDIEIIDLDTASAGNDFALDDISLVPEPTSLCLMGSVLSLLALWRR